MSDHVTRQVSRVELLHLGGIERTGSPRGRENRGHEITQYIEAVGSGLEPCRRVHIRCRHIHSESDRYPFDRLLAPTRAGRMCWERSWHSACCSAE